MSSLPFADWPDATVRLMNDPYRHISSRCRGLGTSGFRTRFLGREAVCLTGAEAARLVYDQRKFVREGAVPAIARDVLFGKGGVQGLDGQAHHDRKAMFLRLMGPDADLDPVLTLFDTDLAETAARWCGEIDLFDEMKRVLARVAFAWAGLPYDPAGLDETADRLADLFLHAGPAPAGQITARRSRHLLEQEIGRQVEALRQGAVAVDPERPFAVIANWPDAKGDALPPEVVAVECLNVLRPTVAIAVYLVFAAHALARHPDARALLRDDDGWTRAFVQEVRRTYPFFPATAAITRADMDWEGETIAAGCRVLLDIYGTNRDARNWADPDSFSPKRFANWTGDPYTLIPQGGGDHPVTHRCPGEWLTIAIMERFVRFLGADSRWRLSDPDTEPDYSALPALPKTPLRLVVD
jgi:fatty-acid peroxygenase